MCVVSVIVPAFNAANTIQYCIDALQNQTILSTDYEIIVIDDGSDDNTWEIVDKNNVHLVSQSKMGPAAARNLGVKCARGSIVLFTDADCVPASNWIEQMLIPFESPEVVGAKGVYFSQQREISARFAQLEYEEKYDRLRPQAYIDFIDTYSAAYRRCVFAGYGG